MSIWDAFGKGRYKGFSREAGQLLDKAVELAGGLGCKKADTGHLLWAMLQSDGGPAARFLAGRGGGSFPPGGAARPSGWLGATWRQTCAGRWTTPSSGHRTPT